MRGTWLRVRKAIKSWKEIKKGAEGRRKEVSSKSSSLASRLFWRHIKGARGVQGFHSNWNSLNRY